MSALKSQQNMTIEHINGAKTKTISLVVFSHSRLFGKLDEMNIVYGLTDTKLEEIFLRVAQTPEQATLEERNIFGML